MSGFITLAKAELAYFDMINDQGGVNGRKISLISLDDGYSPPKTVEQTRKLVEEDQVLAISGSLGTPTNAAVQKYLNQKKVPQLFLASGASRWNDPKNFPYTMTLTPIYTAEASIYAAYVLKEVKEPRVAVLYQNDDFGKDFIKGFQRAAGGEGQGDHRARGELRGDRRHGRFADHRSRRHQGQRVPQHQHAQVRRAGDPQGARARLEAAAVHRQPGRLDRHRHAAGRHRGVQGHHLGRLREGPDRSAVQGRSRSSRPGWRG